MRLYSLGLLLGLAVSVAAPAADANTTTRYSGANCWRFIGEATNAIVYDYRGAINDETGSTTSVGCPVVWQGENVDVEQGRVFYTDGSSTQGVSCSMTMVGPTGTVYMSSTLSSTAAFTGNSSFTFSNPFSLISSVRSYSFFCNLPAKAGTSVSIVRGYRVEQVSP
jgi:hypothetical protein